MVLDIGLARPLCKQLGEKSGALVLPRGMLSARCAQFQEISFPSQRQVCVPFCIPVWMQAT